MTDPRRFDLDPDFKFIFLLKKIGAHYKKINLIVHTKTFQYVIY